jgi:ferredoxin
MTKKSKKEKKVELDKLNESLSFRTKRRVVLEFPPNVVQTPITYMLAKEYDIISNILRAEIAPEESGKLVLEMDGLSDRLDEAIEKIRGYGIEVTEIARKVAFDMDKCMHCGACISVCLAGALKLDENYHLQFIEPKCTVCEMCVPTCPVDAVTIDI